MAGKQVEGMTAATSREAKWGKLLKTVTAAVQSGGKYVSGRTVSPDSKRRETSEAVTAEAQNGEKQMEQSWPRLHGWLHIQSSLLVTFSTCCE